MRNSYIVNITALAVLGLLSCNSRPARQEHTGHEEMPDSSIAVLARPVNAQVVAGIPAITPESGARIYASRVYGTVTYDTRNQQSIASRVTGRVERLLVRYNYQPVRKGQLIMEIYSPDLAAAQRELLFTAGSNSGMLSAARQRLELLGMPSAQIEEVLRTGKILYRVPVYSNGDGYILEKEASAAPAITAAAPPGDDMGAMGSGSTAVPAALPAPPAPAPTPVMLREGQYVSAGQPLFTIYRSGRLVAEFAFPPQLTARIRQGQRLLFWPVDDRNNMQTGSIGLIEPVFRNGQDFTLARVYLDNSHFRAGQLLTASVPVMYTDGWWVPRKAVWRLGNQSVVFRKEKDVYVPAAVTTGAEAGDMVQVTTNIGDWKIAPNAAYLVDSEGFIKIQ